MRSDRPAGRGTAGGGRTPTVGVVIPAHDAAAFIGQALAGVAAQSLPADRVVVVDDASSDGTADLAESWSDRLPLTVIRVDRNVGSGEARRRAIAALDTELLATLDADDVWLPDHLEHLVGLWCRRPAVVSARAEVWVPGRRRRDYHRALGLRFPEHDQLAALLAGNFVFFGSVFSREHYDAAGGFGAHRGWEDWELWVTMAAAGVPMVVAEFPTVLYRRHDGNLTQDTTAFDQALVERIEQFRREHPEWLTARQWDAALRRRRSMVHLHRATGQMRRHERGAAGELARALRTGGPGLVAHTVRLGTYRLASRGAWFRPGG